MKEVFVGAGIASGLLAHARETRPNECCGILLGRGDHVTRFHRATNLSDSPTQFLIDPADHISARRLARIAKARSTSLCPSMPAMM